MRISEDERSAIEAVIHLGRLHGFGNLMQHMATAWAETLMRDHGMDEAGARAAALLPGYPFAMQRDLRERGEWDETGERYRTTPAT